MWGTVTVVGPTAAVPSQTDVDAEASKEIAALTEVLAAAQAQGEQFVNREQGQNGSTLWHVRAGNVDFLSNDERAQSFDFLPKNLTIQAGDTVDWSSGLFHTVSFVPQPPHPDFVIQVPQPAGPPMLTINPEVGAPARPDATYDPSQYYNSGIIGPLSPGGVSWSLSFTTPGTYDYVCLVHEPLGMKGTITVLP